MNNVPLSREENRAERLATFILNRPTWELLLYTGIILGLAFPPNPIGFLFAAVGLVPLLVAIERAGSNGEIIRWSYLSFLYFSALTTWWVGSWQANADPWLMTSSVLLIFIHPLFFVLPILLYTYIRKRMTLKIGLAFLVLLWCGGEYLHALSDASYPWLTLGNSETYNLIYIQFIEYTGVWGLSLLLLIINAIVTYLIIAYGAGEPIAKRRLLKSGIIIGAILLLPYIPGYFLYLESGFTVNNSDDRYFSVTIVQPNQNPWDKWRQDDTVDHIMDNASLTLDMIRAGAKPDLVLWAENAIPYLISLPEHRERRDELATMIDMIDAPVMTGFPDMVIHASKEEAHPSSRRRQKYSPERGEEYTEYYDLYNSIGLFMPGSGLVDRYHKTQLVPFGERIPFIDAAPFLTDMLSWDVGISSWGKGEVVHAVGYPGRTDSLRIGGMVCFESVYPNIVRKFTADGAQLLTIVTNDGWYLKTPGPLQHERFAILRAIENRRGIARAANTGISCFILPSGVITRETEEGARIAINGELPLRTDRTLYVRLGDWLPITSLVAAALLIIYGLIGFRKPRQNEAQSL